MKLDPALESALVEVVEKAGQPEVVATRLKVWLESMNDEYITNDDLTRYLNSACQKLKLEHEDAD